MLGKKTLIVVKVVIVVVVVVELLKRSVYNKGVLMVGMGGGDCNEMGWQVDAFMLVILGGHRRGLVIMGQNGRSLIDDGFSMAYQPSLVSFFFE